MLPWLPPCGAIEDRALLGFPIQYRSYDRQRAGSCSGRLRLGKWSRCEGPEEPSGVSELFG